MKCGIFVMLSNGIYVGMYCDGTVMALCVRTKMVVYVRYESNVC